MRKISRPFSLLDEISRWCRSLQKWGTSIAAAGSVAMSRKTLPGAMALSRFEAFKTGKGH